MQATIKRATARNDYKVEIDWADGSRSTVDFASTIRKGGVFAPLADGEFFVSRLTVGDAGDWLSWPGDLDFSADSLWYRSHPDAEIEEASAARR
jgi:hypothetical protein